MVVFIYGKLFIGDFLLDYLKWKYFKGIYLASNYNRLRMAQMASLNVTMGKWNITSAAVADRALESVGGHKYQFLKFSAHQRSVKLGEALAYNNICL